MLCIGCITWSAVGELLPLVAVRPMSTPGVLVSRSRHPAVLHQWRRRDCWCPCPVCSSAVAVVRLVYTADIVRLYQVGAAQWYRSFRHTRVATRHRFVFIAHVCSPCLHPRTTVIFVAFRRLRWRHLAIVVDIVVSTLEGEGHSCQNCNIVYIVLHWTCSVPLSILWCIDRE